MNKVNTNYQGLLAFQLIDDLLDSGINSPVLSPLEDLFHNTYQKSNGVKEEQIQYGMNFAALCVAVPKAPECLSPTSTSSASTNSDTAWDLQAQEDEEIACKQFNYSKSGNRRRARFPSTPKARKSSLSPKSPGTCSPSNNMKWPEIKCPPPVRQPLERPIEQTKKHAACQLPAKFESFRFPEITTAPPMRSRSTKFGSPLPRLSEEPQQCKLLLSE